MDAASALCLLWPNTQTSDRSAGQGDASEHTCLLVILLHLLDLLPAWEQHGCECLPPKISHDLCLPPDVIAAALLLKADGYVCVHIRVMPVDDSGLCSEMKGFKLVDRTRAVACAPPVR